MQRCNLKTYSQHFPRLFTTILPRAIPLVVAHVSPDPVGTVSPTSSRHTILFQITFKKLTCDLGHTHADSLNFPPSDLPLPHQPFMCKVGVL